MGCGNGEHLILLCARGGNRGIGFDPTFEESRGPRHPEITFVRALFDAHHAERCRVDGRPKLSESSAVACVELRAHRSQR